MVAALRLGGRGRIVRAAIVVTAVFLAFAAAAARARVVSISNTREGNECNGDEDDEDNERVHGEYECIEDAEYTRDNGRNDTTSEQTPGGTEVVAGQFLNREEEHEERANAENTGTEGRDNRLGEVHDERSGWGGEQPNCREVPNG